MRWLNQMSRSTSGAGKEPRFDLPNSQVNAAKPRLAGFTDVRLQPQDELRLLEYGCGITAVVRRPTKRAAEISPEEFRQARLGFEAKMRHYAPRSIAFLGKRALSAMIGRPDVDWGRFPMEFAGTMAWILPNPSGLNRGFTLDALVSAYAEFRIALARPAETRTRISPC